MNDLLQHKRILVTGAARGLGFAFAEAVCQAGGQVVIADILVERGEASAQQLDASFVPLDLAKPESIQQCAERAAELLGGLDGVVNNGAIATGIGGKTFEEFDIDTWDRVMAVNRTRHLADDARHGTVFTPDWGRCDCQYRVRHCALGRARVYCIMSRAKVR